MADPVPTPAEIARSLSDAARSALVSGKIVGIRTLAELMPLMDLHAREWNDLGRAVREEVLKMEAANGCPVPTPAPSVSVSGISPGVPIRATVQCRQCGHVESIVTRGNLSVSTCPKCGGTEGKGVRVVEILVG